MQQKKYAKWRLQKEHVLDKFYIHFYITITFTVSALYMEQLARLSFGCKTSVLDIRDVGGKWEFLNCLARGDVLLVPYDPDKNYVPVLKKGHKAHWALITGL